MQAGRIVAVGLVGANHHCAGFQNENQIHCGRFAFVGEGERGKERRATIPQCNKRITRLQTLTAFRKHPPRCLPHVYTGSWCGGWERQSHSNRSLLFHSRLNCSSCRQTRAEKLDIHCPTKRCHIISRWPAGRAAIVPSEPQAVRRLLTQTGGVFVQAQGSQTISTPQLRVYKGREVNAKSRIQICLK